MQKWFNPNKRLPKLLCSKRKNKKYLNKKVLNRIN